MAGPGAAGSFNPGPLPWRVDGFGGPGDQSASDALNELGPLLVERLLGALELCLDALPVDVPVGLPVADRPSSMVVSGLVGGPDTLSEAVTAVSRLDQFWPLGTALITSLVPTLAAHPAVAPLIATAVAPPADGDRAHPSVGAQPAHPAETPDRAETPHRARSIDRVRSSDQAHPSGGAHPSDEAAVAARHGAAHLALAVAVAAVVLRAGDPPLVGARPPVIVGAALGAAAVFLRSAPMPPAYGPALLARRRAEYLLPRSSAGAVEARDHRFALAEGPGFPGLAAAFAGNGLVEVVPGGAVIRTGAAEGPVRVTLRVLAAPPPDPSAADRSSAGQDEFAGWNEVVEVSYLATAGSASVFGPGAPAADPFVEQTPPWAGDYRLRVLARDRDHADDGESYELLVWAAPPAPERVLKRTDRLGHRLRGEAEPPAPLEARYRWVRSSGLREAATVTVVAGARPDDVLRAFGADPTAPVSRTGLLTSLTTDPWLAVVAVGGTALAVEDNGYQGTDEAILRALSRLGPVASMFWNGNAAQRLSFVRDGVVIAADISQGFPAAPEFEALLDGLDLADDRSRIAQGLTVVERITGYRLLMADLDRIHTADIAYRVDPPSRSA